MEITGDTLVPLDWCKSGEQLTIEQWGQKEYDVGFKIGREHGIKAAVTYLEKLSAEYFIGGKDELAKITRNLASEIKNLKPSW